MFPSFPETVYLSTLLKKKKKRKKFLKNLQGLKKTNKQKKTQQKKTHPIYSYFAMAQVVKSSG